MKVRIMISKLGGELLTPEGGDASADAGGGDTSSGDAGDVDPASVSFP